MAAGVLMVCLHNLTQNLAKDGTCRPQFILLPMRRFFFKNVFAFELYIYDMILAFSLFPDLTRVISPR